MRMLILLLAPLLMAQSEPPLVPESIHSDASGPPELCGLSGRDVADIERKVVDDFSFQEEGSTDKYRVFVRERDFVQFVFPRPATLSFPMATCRKVISQSDGTYVQRELHCAGTREECDRIYLEFQALDDKVKQALSGK